MSGKLTHSFALSVASLFVAGACGGQASAPPESPAQPASEDANVKCLGINACKGQAQCDMPTHSCAGLNECKGKGWILVPKAECDAKGGAVKS